MAAVHEEQKKKHRRKKHDRREMLKVKYESMLMLECQMKGQSKLEPIWNNNHSPTLSPQNILLTLDSEILKEKPRSQELVYRQKLLMAFLGWSTMPSR